MDLKKEKLLKEERGEFSRGLIFIWISLCGLIFVN